MAPVIGLCKFADLVCLGDMHCDCTLFSSSFTKGSGPCQLEFFSCYWAGRKPCTDDGLRWIPLNVSRFGRDFKDVAWVSSPLVYWGLSTSRVLTLEYLPGIKISDVTALRAAGIDTKLVARRATEAYLIQLLQTSFLHSDVHPGNIGIDRTGVHLHPT